MNLLWRVVRTVRMGDRIAEEGGVGKRKLPFGVGVWYPCVQLN